MKKQMEKRLNELRAEYESGQQMITETEASLANMRASMMRISGAIQVLEELLGQEASERGDGEAVEQVAAAELAARS